MTPVPDPTPTRIIRLRPMPTCPCGHWCADLCLDDEKGGPARA